jgi:outer membrane protein OmpA-like peptidoglycan-associated protein
MLFRGTSREVAGVLIVLAAALISSCAFAQSDASPAAACSVQPSEVIVGEPVKATVIPSNFNPKHTLSFIWNPSDGGGKVIGHDATAQIETTNAAPGNYTVTAYVTDIRAKKNSQTSCSANFTIKPPPPRNPPTMSVSAGPTSVQAGGTVNLSASCTSPDGVPFSVAGWTAKSGTVSGAGSSATLDTAGASPGSITVSATCTDSRGLTTLASTEVTVENPPAPTPLPAPSPAPAASPEIKAVEARLDLRSIYFPTSMPSVNDANAGLVESQQQTLVALAADFKKYLESNPEAHLILEGHADPRGRTQYDEQLSERRADRVKRFLIEQGIPAGNIDTKALGARHALTEAAVRRAIETDPQVSPEERQRALKNLETIVLASDRRVDITLSTTGESSVRQFPFNAADALTLIGGR